MIRTSTLTFQKVMHRWILNMAKVQNFCRKVYRKALKAKNSYPIDYYLDSPQKVSFNTGVVNIEGWVLPRKDNSVTRIEAIFNSRKHQIKYGTKREDVAKLFPKHKSSRNCGFQQEIKIDTDGLLEVQVEINGERYEKIYSAFLRYSPEELIEDIINPNLSNNWAEHVNLQSNKKAYYYEEPAEGSYERGEKDPRIIAFYLPQFHPIEENNRVWGEGFTEWTNVASDTPRFIGHTQPFLPKDTGFYDLRLEQNIESQINRAKKHGIYGFCFYYYWFSGRRLLENPLNSFLKREEWDFNFTICWANENWTKRWDGRDNEIIVAQKYHKDDPLKFIKDVEDILLDPRYIKEDGKPVLIVFRASELKDPEKYAKVWREYFRKQHETELHLVSIISFENKDPRDYGFDVALDFAPQSSFFKNDVFEEKKYPFIDVSSKLIDKEFSGLVADYRNIALNKKAYEYFDYPSYKCVTPSWDNDARKKNKGFVMQNESPDIYAEWLHNIMTIETQDRPDPLIFINAWNEWAEGTTLEPTMHYGSAILNRTTEVLSRHSQNSLMKERFPMWQISPATVKLAVVVHLYYTERWEEIKARLQHLNAKEYDLFVSLNMKDKSFEKKIKEFRNDANIKIVPNRGRDILPFINLLPKLKVAGYKSVLKIHSKRSNHRDNGADWFKDIIEKLILNKSISKEIAKRVNEGGVFVGPEGHYISLERYMGSNETHLSNLLSSTLGTEGSSKILKNAKNEGYFAGSMFWASLDVLTPLSDLHLLPEDFESERGQIDGTLAHAIERYISIVAACKYESLEVNQDGSIINVKDSPLITAYPYAD